MGISNPFLRAAARYHRFRPRYHSNVVDRLVSHFGVLPEPVLDLGCGTGHSTVAFAAHANQVIGCDASQEMIAEARSHSEIHFVQGLAEALPFGDHRFALINVSMGFHWFDAPMFLREARRVLIAGGHISVDDCGFLGEMAEDRSFRAFHERFWGDEFPAPPRGSDRPDEVDASAFGFERVALIEWDHWIAMSLETFVQFHMTQSNALTSSRSEEENLARLVAAYTPYFGHERRTLRFGGHIELLRVADRVA